MPGRDLTTKAKLSGNAQRVFSSPVALFDKLLKQLITL